MFLPTTYVFTYNICFYEEIKKSVYPSIQSYVIYNFFSMWLTSSESISRHDQIADVEADLDLPNFCAIRSFSRGMFHNRHSHSLVRSFSIHYLDLPIPDSVKAVTRLF